MKITGLTLSQPLKKSLRWRKFNIVWLIGLFFGGVAIYGYTIHHMQHKDSEVNTKFHILLVAMAEQDNLSVKLHAKDIISYSDRTPYPRLAGILWAKVLITENDLAEAAKVLSSIIKRSKNKDGIWHLANLRLIKVCLMAQQFDEAEKLLSQALKFNQYITRYKELYGDLLACKHKLSEAHKNYNEALQALPPNILAPWLNLKKQQTELDNNVLKIET